MTPRRHIHVRRAGSWAEQFALLFRDYLCTHEEEARRYEALKYQLAARYKEDRHGYTEAKTPFILLHSSISEEQVLRDQIAMDDGRRQPFGARFSHSEKPL